MAQRGLTMEKFMMSMGPAEVAGLLIGYEKFYLGMFDDPARLKRLMELVTDFIIDWLKMQGSGRGWGQGDGHRRSCAQSGRPGSVVRIHRPL